MSKLDLFTEEVNHRRVNCTQCLKTGSRFGTETRDSFKQVNVEIDLYDYVVFFCDDNCEKAWVDKGIGYIIENNINGGLINE